MPVVSESDALLVARIRKGDNAAWVELVHRFEGRLLAFAESRVGRRSASEDVVQETFIGFLTSLPNYDLSRPLESYLFSIAAHKLTDYLRREGRRPTLSFSSGGESQGDRELAGSARGASSLARSGERKNLERDALAEGLQELVENWKRKGDWHKIKCVELLYLLGRTNKEVAGQLALSEQQVANLKHDFLESLKNRVKKTEPDPEVFPELYPSE